MLVWYKEMQVIGICGIHASALEFFQHICEFELFK